MVNQLLYNFNQIIKIHIINSFFIYFTNIIINLIILYKLHSYLLYLNTKFLHHHLFKMELLMIFLNLFFFILQLQDLIKPIYIYIKK